MIHDGYCKLASLVLLSLAAANFFTVTIAAEPASRPNILFIAVDDLKPILGCYEDEIAITPSIDRIAKDGTVFLNAHCQWPVCGPTRASLMTSLRPEATGVTNLKTDMRKKNPNILTLPQHFKNNGYVTAGTGKIYDPRCVDNRQTSDAPSWSVPFTKLQHGNIKFGDVKQFAMAPEVLDGELIDGQIALSGIKLLKNLSKSSQPFFLAVGFKKPHLPFVAPKKYWDMYRRDQFPLATHRGGIENASGYTLHDSDEFRGYAGVPAKGEISIDVQREAMHGYYACTSYIDAQVGILLDELDELGLSDNTSIVLWGDHGFHLGDHAMWGKHSTLEQATRVPLIVRPHAGTAIANTNTPVELTDVFPTLCELAGIDCPTGLSGRSLMPIVSDSTERVREGALTVFRSSGSLGYSYRSERYRYTEWINKNGKIAEEELFDYKNDPQETKNVIDDPGYAAVHKTLAQQMRSDAQGCDLLQTTDANEVALSMHTPAARSLAAASDALEKLKKGNARFVSGSSRHPHENRDWRDHLEEGQHPFAVVLGCSDSRAPPELIFDQGFGDLFVIRVAGNVVDTDVIGSIEYTVLHLHTPLVVVMGHTGCGAVSATVDHFADEHDHPAAVMSILKRIEPSLKGVSKERSRAEQISDAVRNNISRAVQKLSSVPELRECIDSGEVRIVGSIYDMQTGKVDVFE